MEDYILLICTVGGSPRPIVESVKRCRPQKVIFIPSNETKASVGESIIPLLAQECVDIDQGRIRIIVVRDGQDLGACVDKMRRSLIDEMHDWMQRGDGYRVVVDFTGGTKCMTAALALVALRWPSMISYVGGKERTKGGVGVVVDGKEQVIHCQNPAEAMGLKVVEEAVTLFNMNAYAAAAAHLCVARDRVERPVNKESMAVFAALAEGYDAWDRFDHKTARNQLKNCRKRANNFPSLFTETCAESITRTIERHIQLLETLEATDEPGSEWVYDLLANAKRRAEEGRYDDAVARIYRAAEALAQIRLKELGFPSTARVPLNKLPPTLQDKWKDEAIDGNVKLSLQSDYMLLEELGDDLAAKFTRLGWNEKEHSPLVVRNQSILAHGFHPVGKKAYEKLWAGIKELAKVEEEELPTFPELEAR